MSDDQPLSQDDTDAALAALTDGGDDPTDPGTEAPAPESVGTAAGGADSAVDEENRVVAEALTGKGLVAPDECVVIISSLPGGGGSPPNNLRVLRLADALR